MTVAELYTQLATFDQNRVVKIMIDADPAYIANVTGAHLDEDGTVEIDWE